MCAYVCVYVCMYVFLKGFIYKIMFYANRESFISSFPLNLSVPGVERQVPDLGGESFQSFTTEYDVDCGFVIYGYSCVEIMFAVFLLCGELFFFGLVFIPQ